jgi:hypothetical protein
LHIVIVFLWEHLHHHLDSHWVGHRSRIL